MKPVTFIKKNCFHALCFFLGISPVFSQGVLDTKQLPSNGYEYIAYLPEGYDNKSSWPVIVYLHGGQGILDGFASGNNPLSNFQNGLPPLINNKLGIPKSSGDNSYIPLPTEEFVVIIPHLPRDITVGNHNAQLWDIVKLNNVVEDVFSRYKIDKDRFYMSGISLGAKGVWDYIVQDPIVYKEETGKDLIRPAAVIPIAGNADTLNICNAKDIYIWALHGDADQNVGLGKGGSQVEERYGSQVAVEIYNNCSPTVSARLDLLKSVPHTSWSNYYDLTTGFDLYAWLLDHSKNKAPDLTPYVNAGPEEISILLKDNKKLVLNGYGYDSESTNNISFSWSISQGDPASVNFLTEKTDKDVIVEFLKEGTFTFKLEASDGVNIGSDQITVNVLSENVENKKTIVKLEYKEGDYFKELNSVDRINIQNPNTVVVLQAIAENGSKSVRFALNNNSNYTTKWYNSSNNYVFEAPYAKFRPVDGAYVISVTPYEQVKPARNPGITRQYAIYINEDPPAVLPVEFLGVAAQQQAGGEVVISWTTASEKNNDFFTIERAASSTDHFEPIGTEKGRGDSHTISQYEFTDHNPLPGTNFYRIKQTDFDGKADYSTVTSVYILDQFKSLLYPNPASNGVAQLQLFTPDLYTQVKVQVMDALGNVLYEENRSIQDLSAHEGGYVLNMKHKLKPGLYFVNVSQGGNIEQRKFIAQ